jgi:hypothetical protein
MIAIESAAVKSNYPALWTLDQSHVPPSRPGGKGGRGNTTISAKTIISEPIPII